MTWNLPYRVLALGELRPYCGRARLWTLCKGRVLGPRQAPDHVRVVRGSRVTCHATYSMVGCMALGHTSRRTCKVRGSSSATQHNFFLLSRGLQVGGWERISQRMTRRKRAIAHDTMAHRRQAAAVLFTWPMACCPFKLSQIMLQLWTRGYLVNAAVEPMKPVHALSANSPSTCAQTGTMEPPQSS